MNYTRKQDLLETTKTFIEHIQGSIDRIEYLRDKKGDLSTYKGDYIDRTYSAEIREEESKIRLYEDELFSIIADYIKEKGEC